MFYNALTDEELLSLVSSSLTSTPLEQELASRLATQIDDGEKNATTVREQETQLSEAIDPAKLAQAERERDELQTELGAIHACLRRLADELGIVEPAAGYPTVADHIRALVRR